ncbi:hypothetical protein [Stenotrophomonas rhizophila]|uniref:hypothetical protein n=1 Tax=Stenotrophomonas rhizophila TaxID=216778 RepID=UPI001E357645|nr:hypothetical protein [Stenotrophomonas rhizophila]MCC7632561.1 hypothetical protein [Stenotrophomonas rhizophila]MCC7663413.1 hypothetical protein [Stenotrophomonas rhizophila]
MAVLELAMLSPTAKHCLQSTIRCGGLIVGPRGYTGREAEAGEAFTAAPVWQLMAHGLVRCAATNDLLLEATNRGIELNDYGVVEINNPPQGLGLIDDDSHQVEGTP